MQTIHLYFNAFHLGQLTYEGASYNFILDHESTKMLIKAGVNIAVFEANKEQLQTKELPLVFKNFLPDTKEKADLLESFGILKTDSDFEKLVKIAKLKLSKEKFWLSLKN